MALTYSPQRWGLDERWREHAACVTADSDLFFPIGVTGPAVGQIAAAKAVCSTCPVCDTCLEFGDRDQPGVRRVGWRVRRGAPRPAPGVAGPPAAGRLLTSS